MSNQTINKLPVDKQRFIEILKLKGLSIRKLGNIDAIRRTEKTIRRYLDEGVISADLLNTIAKYLDVSSDYLSGAIDMDRVTMDIGVKIIQIENGMPTIIEYDGKRYVYDGR